LRNELLNPVSGNYQTSKTRYIYTGDKFIDVDISPVHYKQDFFDLQIQLESNVFYEHRKRNSIVPYKISDCSESELDEIETFFWNNRSTFFFLFDDHSSLIGSILILKNYIQSLAINKKFQRQGFGTGLSKFAINYIIDTDYDSVELNVLHGNTAAHKLYSKLGFRVEK
jgi:ribosomal protein S18 acetylase RimI-like enzyme